VKALDSVKAFLVEKAGDKEAPHAVMAVDNQVTVAGEGLPLELNLARRDVEPFAKDADLAFIVLADVEEKGRRRPTELFSRFLKTDFEGKGTGFRAFDKTGVAVGAALNGGDGGCFATKGTAGILFQGDELVTAGKGVDDLDPSGKGLAKAKEILDRFGGLPRANNAAEGAENACLRTVGDRSRLGRMREKTAIAGRSGGGVKDTHLSLKLKNAAVNEGLSGQPGGIIDEIAGGEVVRSVNDEVILADEGFGIFGGYAVGTDFHH